MPPANKRPRSAAPVLTRGGIETLLRSNPQRATPVLQVVGLHRLSLDEQWLKAAQETLRPELGDAFDLTLSDGVSKFKCALSTVLNDKVYQGWLSKYAVVRIADWRVVVDERIDSTSAAPPPLVVVTALASVAVAGDNAEAESGGHPLPQVLAGEINARDDAADLPFHADALAGSADQCARQTEAVPLLGARKHYLRLDSDEVLLTARWMQGADDDEPTAGGRGAPDEATPELPPSVECPPLSRANLEGRAHEAETAAARVMAAEPARRAGRPPSKAPAPVLVGRIKRIGPLIH